MIIKIAGEDLVAGILVEENEEGFFVPLVWGVKNLREIKNPGQVQEDILKGQECHQDPFNGKIYLVQKLRSQI